MIKAKCIIVDDEPLARKVIINHLKSFEQIDIIAECENAVEAGNILRKEQIDLIFLDVEMPRITGFNFLSSLKNPPKIIIVTAYRNYALTGYEFDIIDYLLKPVSFERFYKAVDKFFNSNSQEEIIVKKENDIQSNRKSFLYINEDKNIHKIYLSDILYIESYREYIKIYTENKSYLTKIAISKIETKLENTDFERIHKSYIISTNKISSFNSKFVIIAGKQLPIGRTYKLTLMKALKFDGEL